MAETERSELLRMGEAAQLLNVSRSKAYEMAQRAEIPIVLVGHSIRVPRAALQRWIEARTTGGE